MTTEGFLQSEKYAIEILIGLLLVLATSSAIFSKYVHPYYDQFGMEFCAKKNAQFMDWHSSITTADIEFVCWDGENVTRAWIPSEVYLSYLKENSAREELK